MKILAGLILTTAAAFGQLQFYSYAGANEVAISGSFTVGTTSVGSTLDVPIRVRNAGVASVTIPRVTLSGQGFRITSTPTLPVTLAPGDPMDIIVQYAPTTLGTYSANLGVNSASIVLVGTAAVAPTISITQDGVRQVLSDGSTIDFGRVQRGSNRSFTLWVENRTLNTMTVASMTLIGSPVYTISGPVIFPLTLRPTESIGFNLQFAPSASLTYSARIALDSRTIPLTGIGFDPAFSPVSIVVEPSLVSGIQSSLSITLNQPAPVTASGTLTMGFQPSAGAADDAAIRFMTAGGRVVNFTFNQGDTTATMGAARSVSFQTGTTAGSLTFSTILQNVTAQAVSKIQPDFIHVDSTISNRPNDVTLRVQVAGYDNSKSASQLAFTFYDATGAAIQPGRITYNATTDFSQFFAQSPAGGLFSVAANFPVTGSALKVSAVDVELTNSAGTTKLPRVQFAP